MILNMLQQLLSCNDASFLTNNELFWVAIHGLLYRVGRNAWQEDLAYHCCKTCNQTCRCLEGGIGVGKWVASSSMQLTSKPTTTLDRHKGSGNTGWSVDLIHY